MAFLSPCVLPMLPVYLIYLAGDAEESQQTGALRRRFINTVGFVLGFTILFVGMGATAGVIGRFLQAHRMMLQRIGGAILVVLGLHMTGLIRIGWLDQEKRMQTKQTKGLRFFSSMLFGFAFSLGWTPCTGPFLGAALFKAGAAEGVWMGMALLFAYSMGLGIPFILLSLLYEKCKSLLAFFRRHMRTVQVLAGILLIVVGLAMLFDWIGYYQRLFN